MDTVRMARAVSSLRLFIVIFCFPFIVIDIEHNRGAAGLKARGAGLTGRSARRADGHELDRPDLQAVQGRAHRPGPRSTRAGPGALERSRAHESPAHGVSPALDREMGQADAWIAATALLLDCPLASSDRDFLGHPNLELIRPRDPPLNSTSSSKPRAGARELLEVAIHRLHGVVG